MAFTSFSTNQTANPPRVRVDMVLRSCRIPALILFLTFGGGFILTWVATSLTQSRLAQSQVVSAAENRSPTKTLNPAVTPTIEAKTHRAPAPAVVQNAVPASGTPGTKAVTAAPLQKASPPVAPPSLPVQPAAAEVPNAPMSIAAVLQLRQQEDEIARLKTELQNAQRYMEDTRTTHVTSVNALNQQLGEKEKECHSVRMVAEDVLEQADREFGNLQEENQKLRCRMSQLESENSSLASQNNSLRSQVAACYHEIHSLRCEIADLKQQSHGKDKDGEHQGGQNGNGKPGHEKPPGETGGKPPHGGPDNEKP